MIIKSVLIANRGEIACRIIETLKKLDITAIAVYSTVDHNAKHVKLANASFLLGNATALESYLNIEKIITVCKEQHIDAIHPGYGFLSENFHFAARCAAENIIFIGPKPSAIEQMASKEKAKTIMQQANVPVIPSFRVNASSIDYPVLIKASLGGGGKGMRLVTKQSDFKYALERCQAEAMSSFNDDQIIIEKYLPNARHIEVQIFRDLQGHCVYLFERDCSIQRRQQKIIEEAPANNISQNLRQQLGQAAIKAASAIDYLGAGTVEFLVDAEEQFFFLEMNTRLQVEHPITEMITGLDLVEWQIKIAQGEDLPLSQSDLQVNGHAIEARIYAEDPANNFLPTIGTIIDLQLPNELARVDSGILESDQISIYYDPLLAKIIAHGKNRQDAVEKLKIALENTHILGITTNLSFLRAILTNHNFIHNSSNTNFIANNYADLITDAGQFLDQALCYAAIYLILINNVHNKSPCWRLNATPRMHLNLVFKKQLYKILVTLSEANFSVTINNINYVFQANLKSHNKLTINIIDSKQVNIIAAYSGKGYLLIAFANLEYQFTINLPVAKIASNKAYDLLVAPMPGIVKNIFTVVGTQVVTNQPLLVLEAMKMQHTIYAPHQGYVKKINVTIGETVEEAAILLELGGGA